MLPRADFAFPGDETFLEGQCLMGTVLFCDHHGDRCIPFHESGVSPGVLLNVSDPVTFGLTQRPGIDSITFGLTQLVCAADIAHYCGDICVCNQFAPDINLLSSHIFCGFALWHPDITWAPFCFATIKGAGAYSFRSRVLHQESLWSFLIHSLSV